MIIYTFTLPKGGSTKTTSSSEAAAQLAAAGLRVLAIDLEPQGNLSTRLGIDDYMEIEAVAMDVLTGEATAAEAAVPSPTVPGVDVLVGTRALMDAERHPEIVGSLQHHLPTLADHWDAVVIDTPPGLGILTHAALAAADVIVAPMAAQVEAFDQIPILEEFVAKRIARMMRRPEAKVNWIMPTGFDTRQVLDREILQNLQDEYGERVTGMVRHSVKVKESYVAMMPPSVYAPDSPGAEDYKKALEVVLSASLEKQTS
ncbi:MAG: ParA family protein [Glutamicibacter sp.]